MASRRWSLVAAACLAAVLPATASASLTKVADPINVAPDDKVAQEQYYPDVAMAADGSFAVSYTETGGAFEQVYVQRFTAGFAKVGARIPVGPDTQRNTLSSIAMAPDGRFAVAYQTYNTYPATPSRLIQVQRFAADGSPVGGPLAPDGLLDQDGEAPALAMADDGRFAVAWIGQPADLRVATYGAAGTLLSPVQQVGTASSSARPSIGMAPDGHFALTAKQDTTVGDNGAVYGWRFDASGMPTGARTPLWTGALNQNYGEPTIGMGADGRTFLAFDAPPAGSYESDVWGRRFDPAGAPLGDRFGVSDYTTYAQSGADVEIDGHGDAFVAYEGQNGTQRWGYVRHFLPDGTPDGVEEHVSTAPDGATQRIHVDSDGRARTVLAYQFSNQGTNNEVFVARYDYAAVTDPPPAGGTPGTPAPSGGTPPPATGSGATAPRPPARQTAAQILAQSVSFPPARACASRRTFGIRLRVPKGSSVTQATVKVNGRTVAVRRGTRLRSTVDLRRLPKGRFTVSIVLRLADGRTVKGERRYRTCAAKGRGGRPKV